MPICQNWVYEVLDSAGRKTKRRNTTSSYRRYRLILKEPYDKLSGIRINENSTIVTSSSRRKSTSVHKWQLLGRFLVQPSRY